MIIVWYSIYSTLSFFARIIWPFLLYSFTPLPNEKTWIEHVGWKCWSETQPSLITFEPTIRVVIWDFWEIPSSTMRTLLDSSEDSRSKFVRFSLYSHFLMWQDKLTHFIFFRSYHLGMNPILPSSWRHNLVTWFFFSFFFQDAISDLILEYNAYGFLDQLQRKWFVSISTFLSFLSTLQYIYYFQYWYFLFILSAYSSSLILIRWITESATHLLTSCLFPVMYQGMEEFRVWRIHSITWTNQMHLEFDPLRVSSSCWVVGFWLESFYFSLNTSSLDTLFLN